jgi:hypothetical protein
VDCSDQHNDRQEFGLKKRTMTRQENLSQAARRVLIDCFKKINFLAAKSVNEVAHLRCTAAPKA